MPDPVQRTAEDIEAELQLEADKRIVDDNDDFEDDLDDPQSPSADQLAAETEASRKGWVPKDQYKGDPSKWVDAKTFNERGERFTKNLQRELELMKRKFAEFEGTKQAFVKFHEETIARKDQEIKDAIQALRVQRVEATASGDADLVVQIEDRIDVLKEQQKEVKKLPEEQKREPGPNPEDPVLLEWIDDGNQWFHDDPKLRDYAIQVGEEMIKDGETARGRKFLDKVAARMAEDFPRKFTKREPQRVTGGVESGSSAAGRGSAGKTERDLPPEDRALMRQFIEAGYTTKEKFLANYFSEGRRVHR
jgi:hypothetical protein